MGFFKPLVIFGLVALVVGDSAYAQDPLRGTLTTAFGDVATIKKKAEGGDAASQVALGHALASNFHATEALDWFRKAAAQGSVQGQYEAGQMLLFGAPGIPQNLAVKPSHAEGVRWTFMAATNLHPNACWNMGKAYREGLGVEKDPIQAYAWLKLFSETSPGSIVGRVEMNQLALKLDTAALQQAENLFAKFKEHNWSRPVVRVVSATDLKLGSVNVGGKEKLTIINNKTYAEGEEGEVRMDGRRVEVTVLKIEKDSVVVKVEGEDEPRVLKAKAEILKR
jgi:hypothetical protein